MFLAVAYRKIRYLGRTVNIG